MILRGIHVAHWCCIAGLDLDELPPGIVVLHGPNRTGKSSLVKAVRACLYDFDHDSVKAELRSSFPDNGAGPPSVAVEFEAAGEAYRLTKVFSRRVDGSARLEKKSGDKFIAVEDSPREASRKARELLGADKSDQGLNHLLWIDQGIIALPEAKKLDSTLEKRLVSVLGVMVTGGDLTFKQALDKRYEAWFGVRGEHRPTSPVTTLHKQSGQEAEKLAALHGKFREVEQAIRDLDDCQAALPAAEAALRAARQELTELATERQRCLERRQHYQQAQRDCADVQQQAAAAQKRLEEYALSRKRWQTAEQEAAQAEAGSQVARREVERLAAECAQQEQTLHAARATEQEHLRTREEIDDRSELLKLLQQLARLDKDSARIAELEDAVTKIEQDIRQQPAPDETVLKTLRGNRENAGSLRSQLQAEALTLAVILKRGGALQLHLDGGNAESVNLAGGAARTWPFRQRVLLEIPEHGSVAVGRSQDNLDLERAARDLARLEREFQETVLAFGEQPDDGCLDRLTERRVRRESALARLDAARQECRQLAPQGTAFLEGERDKLRSRRQIILERCPHLQSGHSSEEEIGEQLRAFQARALALQKTCADLEKAEKQTRKEQKTAQGRLDEWHEKAIRARTMARNACDELQRLGDELSLQAAARQAEEALAGARRRLRDAELTEQERTVDQRYQDAETAAGLRDRRCLELQKELERHRGQLQGSAGLHPQIADAEASLREVQDALARERLEADAHKRLHDLFEQCRDNQVQQVMGPIADRVLGWTRTLGLSEYGEFRFGDRFLPEGLVLQNGDPDKARALENESYGTVEQLGLLVRLALGGVLARDEPVTAILDDPLAHADASKHRRILDIIRLASEGNPGWNPPAGRLQVLIFTCHPDRFDHLPGVRQIDLGKLIVREA